MHAQLETFAIPVFGTEAFSFVQMSVSIRTVLDFQPDARPESEAHAGVLRKTNISMLFSASASLARLPRLLSSSFPDKNSKLCES